METYRVLRGVFGKSYTPETVERMVADTLASELDGNKYIIINNALIPSRGNTARTQIDHIIISIYGIFCIETKSHRGLILGSKRSKIWSQYLQKRRFSVNNPYHQNLKHVKALEELFAGKLKTPIASLVTFPLASKVIIDNEKQDLSIAKTIQQIETRSNQLYSVAECQQMIHTIYEVHKPESPESHIAEVNKILAAANK